MNSMTKEERERALRRMRVLLKKPRTADEVIRKLNISRRTFYRYLYEIEGIQKVGISRPTRYQIA
jgi:predicted DNA-binding transcriptional regulator AlpA